MRYIFFLFPMILSYLGFLILFFGGSFGLPFFPDLLPLPVLVLLLISFVFFLNLSTPDIKKLGILEWQRFFVLSFFLLLGVLWGPELARDSAAFFANYGFQCLAGILLLCGIVLFLQTKEAVLDNRVVLHARSMHYAGVFIFSLFISLFLALYSFGAFKALPFSCEEIQSSQESFLGTLFSPVRTSNNLFRAGKEKVTTFLETDVADMLAGFVDREILMKTKKTSPTFFQEIKNTLLIEAFEEKKEVDETICEFMSQLISDKWNKAGLQYSVVFLIFLLLYPFLGITFFATSILSYLLFALLQKVGVWRITESLQLVQDIE